jgi:outer membrane protein
MPKHFKIFTITFFFLFINASIRAQKKWSLKLCIDYAHKNSLDIIQTEKRAVISENDWKISKADQLPSASGAFNNDFQAGRFINGATNDFTTQETFTSAFALQGSVDLFNWFRKRNIVHSRNYEYGAALKQTEQTKNLVTLDVAAAYLQILLAKEQLKLSEAQIKLTQAQLANTQQRVRAGVLPELNLVQVRGQLIKDSAGYNDAYIVIEQNIFLLRQLMNLPLSTTFDIEPFVITPISGTMISNLNPELVYQAAVETNPAIQSTQFKIQSLQSNYKAVRAQGYPNISLLTGLQSLALLNPPKTEPIGSLIETQSTISNGKAIVNTVPHDVFLYQYGFIDYKRPTITQQLKRNFRQNIGLAVTIPIFNNQAVRINSSKSLALVEEQKIQKDKEKQQLKKVIYLAYYDTKRAYQKFIAAKKAVDMYQQAYNFALDRYKMGVVTTVELLITQNDLFKAKIDELSSHYDFIFKIKVLEFYKSNSFDL